jgi:3-deoxy-D-manno-octulosonate 8-phosphate phosphatase (KDO 8-P phosphatase)
MNLDNVELINKAKKIKVIISDVDGVLTNGDLFINKDGEEPLSRFNIYDGFAVIIAHECGLKIGIISGRHSFCTLQRFKLLGVEEVHTGIGNKKTQLLETIKRLNVTLDEVAYIGDDLIDLGAISIVGLSIAPSNAVCEVIKRVDTVTKTSCGNGVLREVVDFILKAQNKYDNYVNSFLA